MKEKYAIPPKDQLVWFSDEQAIELSAGDLFKILEKHTFQGEDYVFVKAVEEASEDDTVPLAFPVSLFKIFESKDEAWKFSYKIHCEKLTDDWGYFEYPGPWG